jgi:hypothetical protein
MAEGHTRVTMDFSGGTFMPGVFALIILFWGEPGGLARRDAA